MTSTTAQNEVLKQDRRGRVRVPWERREALLEEFARSGLFAAAFDQMAWIKYATFANWLEQRRKAQQSAPRARSGAVIGRGARSHLERSLVAPGLLAQIVVAKYCDHLPL